MVELILNINPSNCYLKVCKARCFEFTEINFNPYQIKDLEMKAMK